MSCVCYLVLTPALIAACKVLKVNGLRTTHQAVVSGKVNLQPHLCILNFMHFAERHPLRVALFHG